MIDARKGPKPCSTFCSALIRPLFLHELVLFHFPVYITLSHPTPKARSCPTRDNAQALSEEPPPLVSSPNPMLPAQAKVDISVSVFLLRLRLLEDQAGAWGDGEYLDSRGQVDAMLTTPPSSSRSLLKKRNSLNATARSLATRAFSPTSSRCALSR